jgi:hypothetical protein
MKAGSSFMFSFGNQGNAAVVLSVGNSINAYPNSDVDTFYCNNLSFDYSQVESSVAESPMPTFSLRQSGDHLFSNTKETPAEIRIMNILGAEVLSQNGTGALDVDLTQLPAGVYFAQVQSGDAREVKKIAVVH